MALILSQIGFLELSTLGTDLRELARDCTSLEVYAQRMCRRLHEGLVEADRRPSTALVRCFLTLPVQELPSPLADFAQRLAGQPLPRETTCLSLVGTAGLEPDWNDRTRSAGHQAIPLLSAEALNHIPMVRQLLAQLDLDVLPMDPALPALSVDDTGRGDRVFHVPDAQGSPHIPAQSNFIVPYGVASVLGLGDMLGPKRAFAILLFSRARIDAELAQSFRILTRHVRQGMKSLQGKPVFEG